MSVCRVMPVAGCIKLQGQRSSCVHGGVYTGHQDANVALFFGIATTSPITVIRTAKFTFSQGQPTIEKDYPRKKKIYPRDNFNYLRDNFSFSRDSNFTATNRLRHCRTIPLPPCPCEPFSGNDCTYGRAFEGKIAAFVKKIWGNVW